MQDDSTDRGGTPPPAAIAATSSAVAAGVELARARERVDALQGEVADLKAEIDGLCKQVEKLEEMCDDLQSEVERAEEDRAEMLDRLGMTEHEWRLRRPHVPPAAREAVAVLTRGTESSITGGSSEAESEPGAAPLSPSSDGQMDDPPVIEDPVAWRIPPLPPEALEEVKAWRIPPLPPEAFLSATPEISWNAGQLRALDEVEAWLSRTDGAAGEAVDRETDYGSRVVFRDGVVRDEREMVRALVGPAGTGKSTLVREIARRHPQAAYTAMTGRAALRLSEAAGVSASTLHRALYHPPQPGAGPKFEALRDPSANFVIVDESSMVSPAVRDHLGAWARRGVRLLLVGDGHQLPPVITGEEALRHGEDYSVFAELQGRCSTLDEVVRNAGGVLRAATRVRETGQVVAPSDLDAPGAGYELARDREPVARAVQEYLADRGDHLVVTWRNAARMRANEAVRAALGHAGPLPDEGEPVLLRRNGQGRMNGEIVLCGGFETGPEVGGCDGSGGSEGDPRPCSLGVGGARHLPRRGMRTLWMRVADDAGGGAERLLVSFEGGPRDKGGEHLDGQQPWVEDWKHYQIDLRRRLLPEPIPITWGYVVTVHCAQGSEARRVTVFLEPGDDRNRAFRKETTLPDGGKMPFGARWTYTAISRAREYALLIVGGR